jgi:hypothetical protein
MAVPISGHFLRYAYLLIGGELVIAIVALMRAPGEIARLCAVGIHDTAT